MGAMKEVFVPDIGDFKSVDVIEILVKPGDTVAVEQSLVTLESDKATMEIPSPSAGVLKEVRVKIGDKVSEGSPILVSERVTMAQDGAPAVFDRAVILGGMMQIATDRAADGLADAAPKIGGVLPVIAKSILPAVAASICGGPEVNVENTIL